MNGFTLSGRRGSGVLIHLTSLPSPYGVGDMGPAARKFVDFLAGCGQSYWQVLPLNPTGPGEAGSPYSAWSAFAGNILLISPEDLVTGSRALLASSDMPPVAGISDERVDYARTLAFKNKMMDKASEKFRDNAEYSESYDSFCTDNAFWLDDYALFAALREHFQGKLWGDWPDDVRDRQGKGLVKFRELLAQRIEREMIGQFLFFKQWMALKEYCHERGIHVIGDIPIYVSYQSADVWAHPEMFKLDSQKKPSGVAGVPPDYFSKTGQLWGNPVYNWDVISDADYDWWIRRIRHNLVLFDAVRIDHFRGFAAFWEVPASATTAVNGKWVEAPGAGFFAKLTAMLPSPPIIAEDLGVITPDVKELMARFKLPGMRVLQFAFGDDLPKSIYAPHNHIKHCIVHTGTHDNNTTRGWFEKEASPAVRKRMSRYIGREINADNVSWEMIRLAMMSVADTCIIPMQDILGLGAEARMNTPSTIGGNWQWRLLQNQVTPEIAARLRAITEIYGRLQEVEKTGRLKHP